MSVTLRGGGGGWREEVVGGGVMMAEERVMKGKGEGEGDEEREAGGVSEGKRGRVGGIGRES